MDCHCSSTSQRLQPSAGIGSPAHWLWIGAVAALMMFAGCNIHYDVDAVGSPDDLDAGTEDVDDDTDDDVCQPESDDELCDEAGYDCGSAELTDRCEEQRTVDCGDCATDETCESNSCVCEPEPEQQLCDQIGDELDDTPCGTHDIEDRCGEQQTVDCGGCDDDFICHPHDNVCQECGVDCDGLCGMVPDGCGNLVDCSEHEDGVDCDPSESCTDFECSGADCSPETECADDECGTLPDGCGGVLDCGDNCPDDYYDCQINECICQPESDDELCDDAAESDDIECGSVQIKDRCGESRSVHCGDCPSGEGCTADNICMPDECVDVDFDTSFQHCGGCGAGCDVGDICDDGTCEYFTCEVDQGSAPGSCNPFDDDDCGSDEYCTLQLALDGDGEPTHFLSTCRDNDDAGGGQAGDSCFGSGDCDKDFVCIEQECLRLCERETHQGCPSDQYCTNPFFEDTEDDEDDIDLDEYGFCTERCSPDADDCGSGARCTADPAFPDHTCTPNFRCLPNGGSSGKSVGDSCNRSSLYDDGCPSGTTCAPVGDSGDDICVTPCMNDDDCNGDACINADAPWAELRYCSTE